MTDVADASGLGDEFASDDLLVCSEGFFFDENVTNLCRPVCGEFNPTPYGVEILEKISVCIGFLASVILIVLALTVQKKTL